MKSSGNVEKTGSDYEKNIIDKHNPSKRVWGQCKWTHKKRLKKELHAHTTGVFYQMRDVICDDYHRTLTISLVIYTHSIIAFNITFHSLSATRSMRSHSFRFWWSFLNGSFFVFQARESYTQNAFYSTDTCISFRWENKTCTLLTTKCLPKQAEEEKKKI